MFADRDQSIVQRGIDEAMACRDMLAPAPVRPSLLARAIACIGALSRTIGSALARGPANRRPAPRPITETSR